MFIAMDFINVDLPEALDPVNSIFCDSEKSLATASAMSGCVNSENTMPSFESSICGSV
ncbi:Uncharacterised protein [Staphylococcus aureus]|nr:Uncharacterised protein [Staphylococcus aureus]SCU54331.1 Uncharacterised protein [Staphylococcus aureus]